MNPKDEIRAALARFSQQYPDTFLLIRSNDELDKALYGSKKLEILNGDNDFFDNGDTNLIPTIENALSSGRQAMIQAAGNEKVLVITAKPGKMLFQTAVSTPVYTATTSAPKRDQTFPRISIGLAILGFLLICCYLGLPLGLGAVVTGYLGMKNANDDPDTFAGKNLALAGLIVGALDIAISLIVILIWLAR